MDEVEKVGEDEVQVEDGEVAEEDVSEWVDSLRSALKENTDYSSIHELCAHHVQYIPDDLRFDVWKVALGVARKPDAMANWDGSLDCLDREAISERCSAQVEQLELSDEERVAVADDMKSVLTFYCKSRNVRFRPDNGWAEVLLPIAAQRCSRGDMYNVLYAITHKYVPRECRRDGRPFHLFRLLLLYHEPELCAFLDTRRISPDRYLQHWLRSLFVATCSLEVVQAMWDVYLLEADPFLIFFLALVTLVNAKDMLMDGQDTPKSEIIEMIKGIPCQLEKDDIDDFCLLAQHYAARTPQSFRMDYHAPLFGPGKPTAMHGPISQALCLPVGLTDLIASVRRQSVTSEDAVGYFVVDCRSIDVFKRGHLRGAHHLDSVLMLQDLNKFQGLVDKLLGVHKERGGSEHWCFISSGLEEDDQYMHMVVAHFLQRYMTYISIARGGYSALMLQMSSKVQDLLECEGDGKPEVDVVENTTDGATNDQPSPTSSQPEQQPRTSASFFGRFMGSVRDKTSEMRDRLYQSMQEPESSGGTSRHVSHQDPSSRRYRDAEPLFSIGGEDEGEAAAASGSRSASESDSEAVVRRPMVNLDTFCHRTDVTHCFKCSEMKPDGYMVPARLVLTQTHLFVLRELPDRAGWAQLHSQHRLITLVKILSKKKYPELITLRFGTVEKIVSSQRFLIPNAKSALDVIKSAILKELERQELSS